MNNLPLNLQLEFAKSKFNEALSACIMEYGLPAFLMVGVVDEILLEIKRQANIELKNSYNTVLEELREEHKREIEELTK